MRKSILMYSLLALGYFVFSTILLTEVSAEVTVTIKSGDGQKTTRGQNFPKPIVFTRAGLSGGNNHLVAAAVLSPHNVLVSKTESGTFKTSVDIATKQDGDFTFYVKAKSDSFYDTCSVAGSVNITGGVVAVTFTGTITNVLYFSDDSATRSVNEGVTTGTNIGDPVSATHWANDDDNVADVTLTYSLEGAGATLFSINSGTGQLKVNTVLDYETKRSYSVTVKVEDSSTGEVRSSDTIDVTINVNDVVETPPLPPPQTPADTPPAANTLPLVETNPVTNNTLTVQRVGNPTVTLSWNLPTGINPQAILEYHYSMDAGQTWTPTGSTNTAITINRDGANTLPMNQFKVRGVSLNADGTARVVTFILSPPPQQRKIVIQECPVGWVRSDGFAGRTRRVLIYEVKLEMDLHNPISIYQPDWVAIYVHPDEGLESLDGWKLQVALPYNHHSEYLLTAENSVVVDSKIEGVDGGFAFIENPEEDPFPMTGIGFTGSPAPGFDYRLYDETGRRIDFGISCYKRFDIFHVLKEMEDPRVLRQVLLESFDWDQWFLRSEWTVPVPVNVQGAPSLQGVNLVGKWADLKKQ